MKQSARRPDEARVAVFAKAPVAGEVKTRLVSVLGPDGAAGLQAGLVRHALSTATQARAGAVELWCSPDEMHPFFTRCAAEFGVTLKTQRGADLGERMRRAAEDTLAAGHAIVIIGADCPALVSSDLREAVEALRTHDAAIAPAEDGGYVLIGLSAAIPGLFDNVEWGGAAVMAQTRSRLAHTRWKELATRWDVDRPEDYARLVREGLLEEVMS
jgi:rSAM/selenodomain-associated transferase 1